MDRSDETGKEPPAPQPPASVREVMSRPRRYRPLPDRKRASSGKPTPGRAQPPLQTAREAAGGVPDSRLWREIEVEDEKWTVRVTGTTSVGTGVDAGPQVLHLTFKAPGDRPNPARPLYVLARGIDEIPEEELAGLVVAARSGADEAFGPVKGRRRRGSRTRPVRRGRRGANPTRS
ncbi:MAG: hypothetical protein OXH49_04285 [Gemmatimonadetes bacterium]|nr:hypothetical protein [Gemmatimonadota bacterium]